MSFVWMAIGVVLLTFGAELLVRGAVRLAAAVGLSPLIIGLTVVAFGTGAPELAVSLKAALSGQADIALGNVVGSNMLNVLFVLGISALIAPLAASSQLVRLDVPVMIGVSALTWLMAANGMIDRLDGFILASGLVGYTLLLVYMGRRSPVAEQAPDLGEEPAKKTPWSLIQLVIGLALLVLGARWFVDGATDLARMLGVSELMIGLTIVAMGTSLPEVATSIVASLRGQRDMAVGNVVGSNIFNILGVLGLTASVSESGVSVAPEAWRFDIPIMTAVAFMCLPIFFTGGRISRLEGALLLGYYTAYIIFLVLAATSHAAIDLYSNALVWFILPITLLAVAFSVWQAMAQRRAERNPA